MTTNTSKSEQLPPQHVVKRTRMGGVWFAAVAFAVVLVLLLIFILENSQKVDIGFFGAHGHLPLGVALLFAAVLGILLLVIPGTARIIQLRMTARGASGNPTQARGEHAGPTGERRTRARQAWRQTDRSRGGTDAYPRRPGPPVLPIDAGSWPLPSRCWREAASPNLAAVNAASRRTRQRETNPVEPGAPSKAPIRSAARSIPITSVLARSVAAAVTFGP